MCRFAVYLGVDVRLDSLITEPVNSIIHQSFHSHEREEPLNGDGFGLAWYPPEQQEAPAVFKSTTPAWSNLNLREVARVTRSRCVLAHVRAATPGFPVADLNCHPFASGRLTFMHNGDLGGFPKLRRRLLAGLSDAAFDSIIGSTDSEHMFAVALDHLARIDTEDPATDPTERLGRALEATIDTVEALRRAVAPDEPAYLNLAICDGQRAAITRYASGQEPTETLYFGNGRVYICDQGYCRMEDVGAANDAVIVASEPLDDAGCWKAVEPGHLVLVSSSLQVSTRPLQIG